METNDPTENIFNYKEKNNIPAVIRRKMKFFGGGELQNIYLNESVKHYNIKENVPLPEIGETSLERIERKIDQLSKEVATRDDVIKHTETLLHSQEKMNSELQEKFEILRTMQMANLPHKRLAKGALAFLFFFAFSYMFDILLGVVIVTRFWSNVGLFVSFGFLLMAWAMRVDWSELIDKSDESD